MSNEPNMSNSEKYRQKRKERIAEKNAKSLEKKSDQSPTSKKTKIITSVSIILVAILVIVMLLLNFFGVFTRSSTALVTPSEEKISMAEYEYYYRYFLSTYHNTAMQYEQSYGQYYGAGAGKMMTGYDYTKTPENQKYTINKLDKKYGKNPTWADYFESMAVQSAYMNRELANEAKKAKIKLSKDDQKQFDSYIEEMRKRAAEDDMSLDAFLRQNFGKGMNEKLFREIFEVQSLAEKYSNKKSEEFEKSISDKDVLNEYNKNKSNYDLTDTRVFYLSSTPATSKDDEAKAKKSIEDTKAKAQAMLNAVTNEETFKQQALKYAPEEQKSAFKEDKTTLIAGTNKDNFEATVSKDAAKWLYSADRKISDKEMFEVKREDGTVNYFVVYVVKTAYLDNTLQPANVRHILVAFDENPDDEKDVDVTEELKAEKRKVAEGILDEWKKGKADEKSFAKLATEKSNDPGSAAEGGLIKDVTKDSKLVEPFKDWCLAPGRKVGDTGIVESTFGYHVMYSSYISKTPLWKSEIKSSLAKAKDDKFFEDFMDKAKKGTKVEEKKIKNHQKVLDKVASNLVANTVKNEDSTPQQPAKKSSSKATKKSSKKKR